MVVRVLIVDDHRIFRESLRHLLNLDPELDVVATVGDGVELLESAGQTKPDVVCMDIKMPRLDGIEATRQLLAVMPEVKIIGLSAYPDRRYVVEMLGAGARGYVTKNEAPAELQSAIHSVCRNQVYFCPEISNGLLAARARIPPGAVPLALSFSPDSREVLNLIDEINQASADAARAPSPDELVRMYQIIEGSTVPSFVLDHHHVVTHWNKACEALTGVLASRIVGTREHWRPFYSEPRPLMADLILDGIGKNDLQRHYADKVHPSTLVEGAYEGEDFFPMIGESGAWIYFTATPLYDAEKRLIGAVETLQDFTARHQAEVQLKESEAHFRQLSITDNLTGLFNTRHFHERLKMEIERAIRHAHPLSLMILDVDNFKNFNDSYGHLEGDQVLKKLAEVIHNGLRLGDSAYRIGGEEFAVLLPDTDLENARLAAERLCSTFAAVTFHPLPETTVRSSVSIGVSHYLLHEKSTTWFRRTDAACYAAKQQGKNCVVVA